MGIDFPFPARFSKALSTATSVLETVRKISYSEVRWSEWAGPQTDCYWNSFVLIGREPQSIEVSTMSSQI